MERDLQLEGYRRMVRVRRFEETVVKLLGSAEILGAVHLSIGQEAAIVGACLALRPDDYMIGTHRSHGHLLGKGADPKSLMAELFGRRTGVNKGKGGSMHLADFSVGSLGETGIVGSGLPIATGSALSAKLRGTDQVALAFLGDRATGEGTFHESMNLAAVWALPVIFYCENNQYPVTTTFAAASAVPKVVDRAGAYSMPAELVDGQDLVSCYEATSRAVARARGGAGPTLIEAKTYRYMNHSQGRAVEARSHEEMNYWRARDPVTMFREGMIEFHVSGEHDLTLLESEIEHEIIASVEFARSSPYPKSEELFDDMYAMLLTREGDR
jgi:TPP-dependent pyruvate/acetoin dehydrogenase alpha subunit